MEALYQTPNYPPLSPQGSQLAMAAANAAPANAPKSREILPGSGLTQDAALDFALEVGETGIPGLGPLGYVPAPVLSIINADRKANKSLQKLCDAKRMDIAKMLNVPPSVVNPSMLYIAAQQDETIRASVDAIAYEKTTHPLATIAGVGGMAGGAALGSLALAPLGPLALVGTLIGGYFGFEYAKSFGKRIMGAEDNRNPLNVLQQLRDKQTNDETITPKDVFMLRVAQHPSLGEYIEYRYGEAFHNMSEDTQIGVMQEMKAITSACARDAVECNNPNADVNFLLTGTMPPMLQAIKSASSGGFVAREAARRAAAPAQGQIASV